MSNNSTKYRRLRQFLRIAKAILGLVLLVIEIVKKLVNQ